MRPAASTASRQVAATAHTESTEQPTIEDDSEIDERTLAAIDQAMANLKLGKRSQAADLKRYARFAI